jgi:hypothetical protein
MAAPVSVITGSFSYPNGTAMANVSLVFKRLNSPSLVDNDIVSSQPIFATLNGSGQLSVSLVSGYYQVTLSSTDTFVIVVPSDGLGHTISSLVVSVSSAYVQSILDGVMLNSAIASSVSVSKTLTPGINASRTRVCLYHSTSAGDIAAVSSLINRLAPDDIVCLGRGIHTGGTLLDITSSIHAYFWPWIGESTGFGTPPAANHYWYVLGPNDNRALVSGETVIAPPPLYYKLSRGGVDLFVIDEVVEGSSDGNPDGYLSSSTQGLWLAAQLLASTAKLKIVLLAEVPYASVDGYSLPRTNWPFYSWGAHMVIGARANVYERRVVDNSPFISVGPASAGSLATLGTLRGDSQAAYDDKPGILVLDFNDGSVVSSYVTLDGDLVDEYFLERPATTLQMNVEVAKLGGLELSSEGLKLAPAAIADSGLVSTRGQQIYYADSLPLLQQVLEQPWLKSGLLRLGDDQTKFYAWNLHMNNWDLMLSGPTKQYASVKPRLAAPTVDKASGTVAAGVVVSHPSATEIWYSFNGADFQSLVDWPTSTRIHFAHTGAVRLFLYARNPATYLDSPVASFLFNNSSFV